MALLLGESIFCTIQRSLKGLDDWVIKKKPEVQENSQEEGLSKGKATKTKVIKVGRTKKASKTSGSVMPKDTTEEAT